MKSTSDSDPFLETARRVSHARRLLVIDDQDSFGKIVARSLSARGIEVKAVRTGAEGVAASRTFRPEVILLDWLLKETSGEAVARELRAASQGDQSFILMMSGVKDHEDAARAVRAGADAFLTKDEVYKLLLPAPRGRSRKAERILVLEDDEGSQDYIRFILAPHGYELAVIGDGDLGLQEARRAQPALILLDLGLPGKNGVELLNIMKSDEQLKRVPVIVMTALTDPDRIIESVLNTMLPADAWMRKPFGENELRARVARALSSSPRKDAPDSRNPDLILERGRIRVNVTRRQVWVNGEPRAVRKTRFDLLRILIAYQDGLSNERILAEGWTGSQDPGAIRKAAQRLREDLALSDDALITTDHGYRLVG